MLVPDNINVIIDCGLLIDDATMEGGVANVTWYKNDRLIVNGSEVNVVLAPDNRTLTITATFRNIPAMVGTEAYYCCEVCVVNRTCLNRATCHGVCSKYY